MCGVKCVNVEVINADITSQIMPGGSLAKSSAENTVSIVFRPRWISREELLTILFRKLQQAFKIAGRDPGMASFLGITVLHPEERVADRLSASSKRIRP